MRGGDLCTGSRGAGCGHGSYTELETVVIFKASITVSMLMNLETGGRGLFSLTNFSPDQPKRRNRTWLSAPMFYLSFHTYVHMLLKTVCMSQLHECVFV